MNFTKKLYFRAMTIERIAFTEIDSTNNYLLQHADEHQAEMTVVSADHQTSGRGQGDHRWESTSGQNLLFSILTHPHYVAAQEQQLLSMAGALALRDVLMPLVGDIRLMWPNDIYWREKKLCGTLIETHLAGKQIKDCVFGIGLNVNQTEFFSDAPNPVSLKQILGHDVERESLLQQVLEAFHRRMNQLRNGQQAALRQEYEQLIEYKTA